MGRGWAVAAFTETDAATSALTLDGLWAQADRKWPPGYALEPLPPLPHGNPQDQFVGSAEHLRMRAPALPLDSPGLAHDALRVDSAQRRPASGSPRVCTV